jgi:lysozyme
VRTAARIAVVIVLLFAGAQSAHGYSNGHLPSSALAPIYDPDAGQTAYLEAGKVAAAWNTMNLCAAADARPLSPGASSYHPAATAYRSYAIQVILRQQLGSNAAIPGHSNHGWGHAVDVRSTDQRAWTDAHGHHFGWEKKTSDASWEWWHLAAYPPTVDRWSRPDPGTSFRYPHLERGSGGACQSDAVKEVQRRVDVAQDGDFGKATSKGVRAFMADHRVAKYLKKHHLHRDPAGQVSSSTWLALRNVTRSTPSAGETIGTTPGQTQQPEAGQDVKAIQGLLNARFNELHRGEYKVPVTGVYDDATRTAVKRFQKLIDKYRHGHLKVTGVVDADTYAALRKSYAVGQSDDAQAISLAGARLVAQFEGFSSRPYRDAVGVWTIGYGHTGSDVFSLSPLSKAAGERLLLKDLGKYGYAVQRAFTVSIGQPEFDAYASWTYNVGVGAMQGSTLLRLANGHQRIPACHQLPRWNRAGGHVLLGLSRRRAVEERLCLTSAR